MFEDIYGTSIQKYLHLKVYFISSSFSLVYIETYFERDIYLRDSEDINNIIYILNLKFSNLEYINLRRFFKSRDIHLNLKTFVE